MTCSHDSASRYDALGQCPYSTVVLGLKQLRNFTYIIPVYPATLSYSYVHFECNVEYSVWYMTACNCYTQPISICSCLEWEMTFIHEPVMCASLVYKGVSKGVSEVSGNWSEFFNLKILV